MVFGLVATAGVAGGVAFVVIEGLAGIATFGAVADAIVALGYVGLRATAGVRSGGLQGEDYGCRIGGSFQIPAITRNWTGNRPRHAVLSRE